MLKSTLVLLTVISLTTAMATSPMAATKIKCTVEAVSENKVTLDCGQGASKLTVGTAVKVKTAKTRAAIEGC